jgi:hypothetical protein
MNQLVIISNCVQDKGFSGGNHIPIELPKRCQHKTETNLHVSKKAYIKHAH